jgi:hypothetical protein
MALCARGRAKLSPLHCLSLALLLVTIVAPAAAAPADTIVVFLDQAQIVRLPDRADTVVIGNPLVADLSIRILGIEKLAVITGKGYGATNFIVLDRKGVELMKKDLEVTGPNDKTVVVYRGPERETYSCTPDCSRRMTLGDAPEFFDKTLGEIVSRNTQATGAGAMTSGH